MTGPLFGTETLAARLYVAARERDGYNDVVTGKGPSTRDQDADQGFYTVRGQLLFVPDDKSTFKLIGDMTRRDENCCGAVQMPHRPDRRHPGHPERRPGPGQPRRPVRPRRLFEPRRSASVEDKGVSLQGVIDTDFGEITSISAIRNWRTDKRARIRTSPRPTWPTA